MYRAARWMVQNQICANIIQTKLFFFIMKQNQEFERELNSVEAKKKNVSLKVKCKSRKQIICDIVKYFSFICDNISVYRCHDI